LISCKRDYQTLRDLPTEQWPLLDDLSAEQILADPGLPTPPEQADNLLRFARESSQGPLGKNITIETRYLLAATGSLERHEITPLLSTLVDEGKLKRAHYSGQYKLTLAAWPDKHPPTGELTDSGTERFFPKGTPFDAHQKLLEIFRKVETCAVIIDQYLDESIFTYLRPDTSKSAQPVRVQLLSNKMTEPVRLAATKFSEQFPNFEIELRCSGHFHDRYLIINDDKCWLSGHSFKNVGETACSIAPMTEQKEVQRLKDDFECAWQNAKPRLHLPQTD